MVTLGAAGTIFAVSVSGKTDSLIDCESSKRAHARSPSPVEGPR